MWALPARQAAAVGLGASGGVGWRGCRGLAAGGTFCALSSSGGAGCS